MPSISGETFEDRTLLMSLSVPRPQYPSTAGNTVTCGINSTNTTYPANILYNQLIVIMPFSGSIAHLSARIYNANNSGGNLIFTAYRNDGAFVGTTGGNPSISGQPNAGLNTVYANGAYAFNPGDKISVLMSVSAASNQATTAGTNVGVWVWT